METPAVVWALKLFRDIILGYPFTVYTDYAAVTELFKGKNLNGRLARWDLTIQEFAPTFKYLPGLANVVADFLSSNVPVGAEDETPAVIDNFTMQELATAQGEYDVWWKVISVLESGDDTLLISLPVPFSQFFLSEDKVLCRYWTRKKQLVAQIVIPEYYVPAVSIIVHDGIIVGHPGKERTLTAARARYFLADHAH